MPLPLRPSRMPPIRTAGEVVDDKRVIEAGQAVTYTFLNELSPPPVDMESADLTCSTVYDNSPPPTPQRTSHNKRRDASYIPRPPNAFILFRSSFIRDQKVSNKVEGNHSNLSKIIGMYWKALTKEQRDEWEAKAAQALIEHRKRYPDWRFRHAANASANVESRIKVKDVARRGRARKDPPDRGCVGAEDDLDESPGKGRTASRAEEEASRLTKIAGLLAEGQEGEALERAVEEWDAEQRMMTRRRSASVSALEESSSSSPVIARASDPTLSTLTLVLSPLSSVPVSGTRSPVMTRACSSSSIDPDLPPTSYGTPVPSPSLSVSSPILTRASSTEREPSLPYPNTPKPRISPSPSSPNTPRLSILTSTSASGSLLNPTPSWPASPGTPHSLSSTSTSTSTPSRSRSRSRSRPRPRPRGLPLPWPPSPAPLRTPSCSSFPSPSPFPFSFPAYTPAERWELEHRLRLAASPTLTPDVDVDVAEDGDGDGVGVEDEVEDEAVSTFLTRVSSSSSTSEITPRQRGLAPSTSTSTMEREREREQTATPSLHACLGLDTPTPTGVFTPSSPRTPLTLTLPCTPMSTPMPTRAVQIPVPIPIPTTPTPTPTARWLKTPVPRVSTSFPTYTGTGTGTGTGAEEWEAKSALSSPVVPCASAAVLEQAPSSSSPSRVYAPPTPTDFPSPSPTTSTSPTTFTSTATSTATSTTTTPTPTHTPTAPVLIPKLPPSWPASPRTNTNTSMSTSMSMSTSAPSSWSLSSPLVPCSASFPAFSRVEDWEFSAGGSRSAGGGYESARSTSTSPRVLSSPIVIHASASASNTNTTTTTTTNRDPQTPMSMSGRRPSVVVSSPLKTIARTPDSTPSWRASPALTSASAISSPVVAGRTPVSTLSWSNAPSSPGATARPPHPNSNSNPNPNPNPNPSANRNPNPNPASDSPATPTPTLSRRSRPQSRSPTQRSPLNPNALCVGTKRSLSAPAPKRGHHRQWWQHQEHQEQQEQEQEPVRMDAGFWWPAPHEQGYCRARDHEPVPVPERERERQNEEEENEKEEEEIEMSMQVHMATPTRDGSFDVFTPQDQDTEHEFDLVGGETGERVWSWSDFGYDSKPTSMYSSIPAPVEIAPVPTATSAYEPCFHLEPTPAPERWFNPWDADTTVHAGEYLHPLPPTPISPIASPLSPAPFAFSTPAHTPCSSFSSLAGWDGSSPDHHTNTNSDAGAGTCAAAKATVAGADTGIDGIGWGRAGLQRLGVQGGGYGDCQWVG